jgi:RimJ/RimL family protein N-acetyltransferase
MSSLVPELDGRQVRLEPLQPRHAPGLAAAAEADPSLYRWTHVPRSEAGARSYVESALAQRDSYTAVPFAVIRAADGAVIGSTRFWDLAWWQWPEGHPRHSRGGAPDTCEIGHTWLGARAVGTGANAEMKRLMLGYAFETWQVQSVCLHTDVRNERSRRAIERIGARFEGVLRAHRLSADGLPRDSARYSITAAEWPGIRHRLDEMLPASQTAVTGTMRGAR